MTDISNTNNSSSSVTSAAGQGIAVESHETLLSSEIRKAMDIIFPNSAVQLLQGGCPLADDTCLNTEGCYGNVHSETTSAESFGNDTVLSSCVPSYNITTLNTTNTAMVTSTDVLLNANGNESPPELLLPSYTDSVVLTNANGNESPPELLLPSYTDPVVLTNDANGNKSPPELLLPSSTDSVAGAVANSNNQDIANTVMVMSTSVLTNSNRNQSPARAVANSNDQNITNTVMVTPTDVLTNANGNESPAGLSTDSASGAIANSNNQDMTNPVMVMSTDVLTNANRNKSPAGLMLPSSTHSVAGAVAYSNNQDIANADIEPESTSLQSAKQTRVKATTAKADLEIARSCVFNDESLEKTSRRLHSADLSSSECHSRGDSDSEDMRRPFAGVAREKKKQKKKKKKDNDSVKSSNSNEINENISTELRSASESCIQNDTSAVCVSNSNSLLSRTDLNCDPKLPEKNAEHESFLYDNAINKCTAGLKTKDSGSQNWILENGYVGSEHFDNSSDMMTEEISNTSFSSTKENKNQSRSKQQLPKIKMHRFNIVKHRKKIMNTFPPCFIVLKKLQMHNFTKDFSHEESVTPLSSRLKLLSDMCDQGLVKCKKSKVEDGEELIYRNIFEETILTETADGYVNSSRGRSLRKRDKKISYVEPSEDDILDEYSRKRNRSKHKDAAARSEDESTTENKKRKKHASLSESKTDTSNTVTSLTIASPQDSGDRRKAIKDAGNSIETSKTKSNSYKAKINGKGKEKTNEIIVYPPACVGSRNVYYAKGGAAAKTSVSYSTLQAKQTPAMSTIQVSPPSTNITILPTTTISGAFMHHPNPVSLFTSLPLSIPVSLPTQNLVAGAPFPTQMSTAGGMKKPPQYCVVKMDGKDVLLQIVSSGGIISSGGIATPVPVVVPKGKTLLTPSVPLITGSPHLIPFHQRASTPSSTQTMPVPLTSVVAVSQGNAPAAAPLQPLMGLQVISRPITTSSQNISVSALPVIQTAQLTSITSTASVRPIHLSSPRQQLSQSPATGLLTPITVLSAANSGASVTSVASTTRSISALPSAVTPMPAPNTTTVVRAVRVPTPNLRAIVPNQATSLRSFRIFVPGCSATGMPSRFATLGTIANSSPLTHLAASSMLLPQRKRSSDQEMTPEMRAAKRRRLEKKYPLPPGVVIKTEPLDAPPKPSSLITTVSGSRSLLSQNLHLLSSSRPGTNFQSIRIIGPSLAGRNVQGNSNIIYRATSIGGGQTILLPTSLGQISTRTTTTVTPVSVSSFPSLTTSSLDHTVTGDNRATNAVNANDSSVSFSSFRAVSEINPSSPVPQSTESTATAVLASVSSNAAELLEMDISSTSSVVISSSEPVLTTNTINTGSVSVLSSGMESLHNSATSTVADNLRSVTSSPSLAAAKGPCEASAIEIVRNGLEELKKFIEVQVVCGLKGDRLEKLKELLRRKEEQYKDMLHLADEAVSLLPASQTNGDIGGVEESDVSLNGPGGSETDPFVID
ncbi:hypothetical protein BsWGS_13073 [Bradybaena similaris]